MSVMIVSDVFNSNGFSSMLIQNQESPSTIIPYCSSAKPIINELFLRHDRVSVHNTTTRLSVNIINLRNWILNFLQGKARPHIFLTQPA